MGGGGSKRREQEFREFQAAKAEFEEIKRKQRSEMEAHDKLMKERQVEARALRRKKEEAEREYDLAKAGKATAQAELSQLEKKKNQAAKDVEKLRKLTQGDVKSFARNQEFHFQKQMEAVEKLPDVEKTAKNSCAFLGRTSVGKTSMINKLFGTQEKTSPIRCTEDIKPVHVTDKVEVYDVFGENDEESYHNLEILVEAKKMHVVVVVYTEAVDSVLKLARLVKALRVATVYVRNKSENLTTEEINLVTEHDSKKLQEVTGEAPRLLLTSAKTGLHMDPLKSLLEAGACASKKGRVMKIKGSVGSTRPQRRTECADGVRAQ